MSGREEEDMETAPAGHDSMHGANEHGASTPSSQQDDRTGGGSKPVKDRFCPFCSQAFTSSSLGRHLDLYIKPKNPKPADGIHDIAEIRRLRAGITRRQPRTSGRHESGENLEPTWHRNARETSTPAGHDTLKLQMTDTTTSTPNMHRQSPGGSPKTTRTPASPTGVGLNVANWQLTGVMNDLPPRTTSKDRERGEHTGGTQVQRMQNMRRGQAGHRVERPEYETEGMRKLEEQAEVGKAAELALREVLGSIKAARKKLEPKEMFPGIDFMALSFPAMCLAILPPPPTIFGPTPFASLESWSLDPPGRKQMDNLRRLFNEQIARKQKDGRENFPDSVAFHHSAHLNSACEHWTAMSDQDRYSTWILELCRSVAKGREESTRLEKQLDQAETRIRHLEAEYDRLACCQLPREYLLRAPQTIPVAPSIARDIESNSKRTDVIEANFDVDTLIDNWRAKVKATARKPTQLHSYRTDYSVPARDVYQPRLQDDMVINGSVYGVNGTFPRGDRDILSSGVEYANQIEEIPSSNVDTRATNTPHLPTGALEADLKEIGRTGTLSRLVRPDVEPSTHANANGKRPLREESG